MILLQTTTDLRSNPQEVGSGLPPETILFRWTVVNAFLRSGIALSKVDELREVFELGGHPLTHSSHLKMFIPKILQKEISRVQCEMLNQYFCISFDGTTRMGEAVNICARFVPPDFTAVNTRLLSLVTTAKHMNGVALFRHISSILMTKLGMNSTYIVGISRDSCATNGVACQRLLELCGNAVDLLCSSHTLQHTGEHLHLGVVEEFLTPWLALVSHTQMASLLWAEMTSEIRDTSEVPELTRQCLPC